MRTIKDPKKKPESRRRAEPVVEPPNDDEDRQSIKSTPPKKRKTAKAVKDDPSPVLNDSGSFLDNHSDVVSEKSSVLGDTTDMSDVSSLKSTPPKKRNYNRIVSKSPAHDVPEINGDIHESPPEKVTTPEKKKARKKNKSGDSTINHVVDKTVPKAAIAESEKPEKKSPKSKKSSPKSQNLSNESSSKEKLNEKQDKPVVETKKKSSGSKKKTKTDANVKTDASNKDASFEGTPSKPKAARKRKLSGPQGDSTSLTDKKQKEKTTEEKEKVTKKTKKFMSKTEEQNELRRQTEEQRSDKSSAKEAKSEDLDKSKTKPKSKKSPKKPVAATPAKDESEVVSEKISMVETTAGISNKGEEVQEPNNHAAKSNIVDRHASDSDSDMNDECSDLETSFDSINSTKIFDDADENLDDTQTENKGVEKDSVEGEGKLEQSIKCEHCGYVSRSKGGHTRHLRKCRPEQFGIEVDPQPKVKVHKCEKCDYSAPKRVLVINHMHSHGIFQCKRCKFRTDAEEILDEHCALEHKDRSDCKFCKNCNRYVKCSEVPLEKHMEECQGRIPFKCPECFKEFQYESSLKCHVVSHYPDQPKLFSCNQCDYKSNYKANLKKHIRHIHEQRGERNIQCQECEKMFFTEDNMRRHLKLHSEERPFKCDQEQCNKAFKTMNGLKLHVISHQTDRPFPCDFDNCEKTFKTKRSLILHLNETHKNAPKNYKCTEEGCSMAFYKNSHLERHIDAHKDNRTHFCTFITCTRAFRTADSLKVHNMFHLDEKPLKCDHCEYTCRQKASIRFHMRKKHPELVPPTDLKTTKPTSTSVRSSIDSQPGSSTSDLHSKHASIKPKSEHDVSIESVNDRTQGSDIDNELPSDSESSHHANQSSLASYEQTNDNNNSSIAVRTDDNHVPLQSDGSDQAFSQTAVINKSISVSNSSNEHKKEHSLLTKSKTPKKAKSKASSDNSNKKLPSNENSSKKSPANQNSSSKKAASNKKTSKKSLANEINSSKQLATENSSLKSLSDSPKKPANESSKKSLANDSSKKSLANEKSSKKSSDLHSKKLANDNSSKKSAKESTLLSASMFDDPLSRKAKKTDMYDFQSEDESGDDMKPGLLRKAYDKDKPPLPRVDASLLADLDITPHKDDKDKAEEVEKPKKERKKPGPKPKAKTPAAPVESKQETSKEPESVTKASKKRGRKKKGAAEKQVEVAKEVEEVDKNVDEVEKLAEELNIKIEEEVKEEKVVKEKSKPKRGRSPKGKKGKEMKRKVVEVQQDDDDDDDENDVVPVKKKRGPKKKNKGQNKEGNADQADKFPKKRGRKSKTETLAEEGKKDIEPENGDATINYSEVESSEVFGDSKDSMPDTFKCTSDVVTDSGAKKDGDAHVPIDFSEIRPVSDNGGANSDSDYDARKNKVGVIVPAGGARTSGDLGQDNVEGIQGNMDYNIDDNRLIVDQADERKNSDSESSDIGSDFDEDLKPPPAPRPPPMYDSEDGDIESGPENEDFNTSALSNEPLRDFESSREISREISRDFESSREIDDSVKTSEYINSVETSTPKDMVGTPGSVNPYKIDSVNNEHDNPQSHHSHHGSHHGSVPHTPSHINSVPNTPANNEYPESRSIESHTITDRATIITDRIVKNPVHGSQTNEENTDESSMPEVDKDYVGRFFEEIQCTQVEPATPISRMNSIDENSKSQDKIQNVGTPRSDSGVPSSLNSNQTEASLQMQSPPTDLSHKRIDLISPERPPEPAYQARSDSVHNRSSERIPSVPSFDAQYAPHTPIDPYNAHVPAARETILRQPEQTKPLSPPSSTPSFMRFPADTEAAMRQRMPYDRNLQNLHRIAEAPLSQHSSSSPLLRHVPGREDVFSGTAAGVAGSMARNPFHSAWPGQDVRPAHWGHPTYLQQQAASGSVSSSLFGKESYLPGREFMFDPSRAAAERNMFSGLPPPSHTQRPDIPHDTLHFDRFDLGSYLSYNSPPSLPVDYTRSAHTSSQKTLDERYRQPSSGVSEYRSLPATSSASDMFGVNSSFNIEKFYSRDPMYHSQHITDNPSNPFLPGVPPQHSMFGRDYPRSFYAQNPAYPFMNMNEKNYSSSASAKLAHSTDSVTQQRDLVPVPRPNLTAPDGQLQDPYRHHSSMLYNMMNKYF